MILPDVDVFRRDTVRLVPTGRLKEAVLRALAPDPGGLEDLQELESATSGRLRAEQDGLPDLAPRDLVFGRVGQTFINAAFTHTRPGGNRFNGEDRGAWYCAFEHETSLAEVDYHLTRALADIGRYDNITDYTELLADFSGTFADLRGVSPLPDCLSPDPLIGYPAGQALARDLRARDGVGLVYPSVRRPGGVCLVAFQPALVRHVRQGVIWRLQWRGSPTPLVIRSPAA